MEEESEAMDIEKRDKRERRPTDLRPVIAITAGDPFGVGPEVILKALAKKEIYEAVKPLVVGSYDVFEDMKSRLDPGLEIRKTSGPDKGIYELGTVDLMDLGNAGIGAIRFGMVTKEGGKASLRYIEKAVGLAMEGSVQGVTTGPIHKKAIREAGYHYAGHTEIFAGLTGAGRVCMMLADKHMRVSHVTTHVAMAEVPQRITKQRVYEVICLTRDALVSMGISEPHIAVAGYNPHAGEEGLFGSEEVLHITPAILAAREAGIDATGPVPPDTVFARMMGRQFDAVVAMYHDQGHIPMKLAGFHFDSETGEMGSMSGVNLTLGLPIIRTSVDHGVAFEIAGQGRANPDSMVDALLLAAKMAKGRSAEGGEIDSI